ncbi:MAG: 50S ribosomal protein L2 [Candidatus Pacebacteria bacterium]|nr:50S ribosomal protein L2 [Candidatus Paceibacterota bacterium]
MKISRPTTPSQRKKTSIVYRDVLTTSSPQRSLTKGVKRSVGRNAFGRITTRHKGGGHKRLWRDIDFRLEKKNIPFIVKTVEYDPNRSGFIGFVVYKDGEKRYILLPQGVKVGAELVVSTEAPLKQGNRLPLSKIPLGTSVYNVEVKPGGGAKLIRSAGSCAMVLAKDGGYIDLKMPSTEVRKVPEKAWASIGGVSNSENKLVRLGKAGRTRWLGIRPTVRGAAMNPVDHPHGGGEGRSGRGRKRAKSKWGKPTGKGQKSRRPNKYSNRLIVSRRKVGKKR